MTINNHHLSEIGFLRIKEVLKLFPVGKSTWWQGVKNGRFPKPVKLGERTTAWKFEDVKALIKSFDNQNLQNEKGGRNV